MKRDSEWQAEITEILKEEGYLVPGGRIHTHPDPSVYGVWAVRIGAGPDGEGEMDGECDFLIYTTDEPGDRVEEVEFENWPPTSSQ